MGEVAAGVTDLLLAAVLAGCAAWLWQAPGVHRYWALMLATAGAGGLAGAAHHLVFAGSRRSSDLSWVAVGVLVALAISYMLAATATELLDRRVARLFIGLRVAGLVAYLVALVVAGIGRTAPLVVSESLTMAAIVGLWAYALVAGDPRAASMLAAIAACAASAVVFAVPAGTLAGTVGLGAPALQHLTQIPGVLLLARAVANRSGRGQSSLPRCRGDRVGRGPRGSRSPGGGATHGGVDGVVARVRGLAAQEAVGRT